MTTLQNLWEMFDNTDVARVPRNVGKQGHIDCLTSPRNFVNVNHIRGDTQTRFEFEPHFEPELWASHLEEMQMRYEDAPTDGRQEAPGAKPPEKR